MNENEIPASVPTINVGKRTCAVYPRSWTDGKGTVRNTIALAEVVPSKVEKNDAGEVVVLAWKRAFKGLNIGLETPAEWIQFGEAILKAFPNSAKNGQRTVIAAK
ncbi:MAG: hypothetical protein ABR585_14250 [Gemmatimonadaceae bacterium]